MANVTEKKKT